MVTLLLGFGEIFSQNMVHREFENICLFGKINWVIKDKVDTVIGKRVGNGFHISFWHDRWCGHCAIKSIYLFSIVFFYWKPVG